MQSIVEIDIAAPQAKVAALLIDPAQNTNWMDDIERCEPVSGVPGAPGSRYRMVPRKGSMVFLATVISVDLPRESRLELDSAMVHVDVTGTIIALTPDRARLTSVQLFRFKGLLSQLFGFLAANTIREAHRRHMEAFKHFVETRERGGSAAG